ncbi:molybdopterin-guanine dinucleotide biosynthesis protein B [Bacillus sp. FJAT-42315]|uniref:molybdopterin-guanine dinucleotide biosynthesis protein B n=1 Tax=Bacillus sp. FJAT-42315 TaxID=2014077 RepID=UPI000C23A4A0|nr:molybdopterin-guanine dinucleotide biosynthesis protein B [Bacillus sp. FJAT-42315]
MALARHCSILQVVGFQNSGKTTLMEKLIHRATSEGLLSASIKHHGHGGVPVNESASKDSVRHYQAGAVVSGVEGAGVLSLTVKREAWSLQQLLTLYQTFDINVIFVEGYKQESYPKVVLLRSAEDIPLLHSLSNIQCVIYWEACHLSNDLPYPAFPIVDDKQYIDFLIRIVREQDGTNVI